ncbi:gliding motility-associated lipoprotein GldH [Saonia flava]|uniref:Gliding motility-associated lipoprotein GldH n=1 Tax=Saonia flava TaxID=523696 RepID=A0A846R0U6_9FLAO|nr:gliding motility lipoprotein GldH [Saonia flava]NJB71555.1 gliding motility-associated lipoprotein GldH [Saonia flava]
MNNRLFFVLLLVVFVSSCNDGKTLFSEYNGTENGSWSKDGIVEFNYSNMDTINPHNLFINIRNDNTFAYSNLFLIAELNYPNGETVKDTLEYEMAFPDGQWMGKGYGSIRENKLWYKENIVFPVSGVYNVQLSHAMRKNGNVEGVINLEGITDVGFQIEKSN